MSIWIVSTSLTNKGTRTSAPVSKVAGFVALVAVLPFTPVSYTHLNDSVFWKEIAIPLAPDPENAMKMTISPDGLLPGSRNAVTYYKNIKNFGNATLVELQLETGRTHQIRVHMAGIGHPLLGE